LTQFQQLVIYQPRTKNREYFESVNSKQKCQQRLTLRLAMTRIPEA